MNQQIVRLVEQFIPRLRNHDPGMQTVMIDEFVDLVDHSQFAEGTPVSRRPATAVFIVDRTFSMDGEPLLAARCFVRLYLRFLNIVHPAGLKVWFIRQDIDALLLLNDAMLYTSVKSGTLIEPAYRLAEEAGLGEAGHRYVFHVTDGETHDAPEVLANAWRRLLRVFDSGALLQVDRGSGGFNWHKFCRAVPPALDASERKRFELRTITVEEHVIASRGAVS